jgi:hypothetical protein
VPLEGQLSGLKSEMKNAYSSSPSWGAFHFAASDWSTLPFNSRPSLPVKVTAFDVPQAGM